MRMLSVVALAAFATPLVAQGNPSDPDKAAQGGGKVPAGWSYRLDRADAKLADVKFEPMGGGFHFTTGPAGLYWRATDEATGGFHTVATFAQTKAPMHPEAYGLFVAGKDLNGPNATYTYFLVRGNGMYSIWTGGAAGAKSTAVVPWTANAAVVKQDSTSGKASNKLEVQGDGKKVTFKVNGTTVHEMDAAGAGIIGIRMNHNLDVHVDGFAVHKL